MEDFSPDFVTQARSCTTCLCDNSSFITFSSDSKSSRCDPFEFSGNKKIFLLQIPQSVKSLKSTTINSFLKLFLRGNVR